LIDETNLDDRRTIGSSWKNNTFGSDISLIDLNGVPDQNLVSESQRDDEDDDGGITMVIGRVVALKTHALPRCAFLTPLALCVALFFYAE